MTQPMPVLVTGVKTTAAGLSATVRLGTPGPPGANITTTVVLSPIDPEWVELKAQLDELLVRRVQGRMRSTLLWHEAR